MKNIQYQLALSSIMMLIMTISGDCSVIGEYWWDHVNHVDQGSLQYEFNHRPDRHIWLPETATRSSVGNEIHEHRFPVSSYLQSAKYHKLRHQKRDRRDRRLSLKNEHSRFFDDKPDTNSFLYYRSQNKSNHVKLKIHDTFSGLYSQKQKTVLTTDSPANHPFSPPATYSNLNFSKVSKKGEPNTNPDDLLLNSDNYPQRHTRLIKKRQRNKWEPPADSSLIREQKYRLVNEMDDEYSVDDDELYINRDKDEYNGNNNANADTHGLLSKDVINRSSNQKNILFDEDVSKFYIFFAQNRYNSHRIRNNRLKKHHHSSNNT